MGARVDCFPTRAAFPVIRPGRHPRLHFRGLLRLHSRYGPSGCSTAQGGLRYEASTREVARPRDHLRTPNPIESVFATVRTKGALSPIIAKLMMFKLVMAAAKTWRRLKGESLLPKIVAGVTFKDGTEIIGVRADRAA